MITILFFILGILFGSFINVCIYRIPKGISVIFPLSYCPCCKKTILWYDNIPLLSYTFLKGRCRFCKAPISVQYPIVEALTGGLFVLFYLKFGINVTYFAFLIFVVFSMIISFIDINTQTIPDALSVPLIIIGIILSSFNAFLNKPHIIFSLIGAITGFFLLYIIALLGKVMFKKEAMGGGDIKIISAIGAFTGPYAVLFTVFIASFLGAVFGLFLIITKKKERTEPIAFGPFLFLGSFMYILFDYFFKNLL